MASPLALFEERLGRCMKTQRLFPMHRWVSVLNASTHPECRALDGRTWPVGSEALRQTAHEHFEKALPNCGCMGMAIRSAAEQKN